MKAEAFSRKQKVPDHLVRLYEQFRAEACSVLLFHRAVG